MAELEWFEPGAYSMWSYQREDQNAEPILLAAYEWEVAGLRGIRVDSVWLHEDERDIPWEKFPEFDQISGGLDAALFAQLIESNRVIRIGRLPAVGRFATPPPGSHGDHRS